MPTDYHYFKERPNGIKPYEEKNGKTIVYPGERFCRIATSSDGTLCGNHKPFEPTWKVKRHIQNNHPNIKLHKLSGEEKLNAEQHFATCWTDHLTSIGVIQPGKSEEEKWQLIRDNARISPFVQPPKLFTDPDERILDYFGKSYAHNRTAVKHNAWRTLVAVVPKIPPETNLLIESLRELFDAYSRGSYGDEQFRRAKFQRYRTSVLENFHQWQSTIDLTGTNAVNLAVAYLGMEMVVLQQMIGPEDDQKAWAIELLRLPYLIRKLLKAATSKPEIIPATLELRAKLASHATMANTLAPLSSQLQDPSYTGGTEARDMQLMHKIDPLIGASYATVLAIREMTLICQGRTRTTPEVMASFIKCINPIYPEEEEPRDDEERLNRFNLHECAHAYVIIGEIYLRCRVLKEAPKEVANLVRELLANLKRTLINFKATWALYTRTLLALVCVYDDQKKEFNELKDALEYKAPMTNISRNSTVCDFIQCLDIQPEDADFWERGVDSVFRKYGYVSMT